MLRVLSALLTAALTSITAPCTGRGDGSGSAPSAVAWATKIVLTSRTANLFTVTADSASFEHLYLFNSNSTYGGAAPAPPLTAGVGIKAVAEGGGPTSVQSLDGVCYDLQ